jgi:hypothetical protein
MARTSPEFPGADGLLFIADLLGFVADGQAGQHGVDQFDR